MKKKIYVCPGCKENHKIHNKEKGRGIAIIRCDCGCNSIIMVKSGYYINSELERVVYGNISNEAIMERYMETIEKEFSI